MFQRIAICFLLISATATSFAADVERSVVQILIFSQDPDWTAPWRFDPVQRSTGSGFVIKGKRIMTNAHVVSWARQIIVRKYQDPQPYLARVEYIGHDCDLALLTVEDDSFFDGIEALDFGELPKVRSTVVTYGYPAGGEEISYTRGVVSRIELSAYSHIGNRRLLSVQTDAAINPGNSGGPVIQDDRVVGVAFQGISGLENTGFFIPPPVIQHFLKDVEDKKYDGFPRMGINIATLQNPAYRAMLKLPDNNQGVRVDRILPKADAAGVLKEDDVILRIGEYPVASDNTIVYQGNRVSSQHAFQLAQSGESVPLKIWRDGQEQDVNVTVRSFAEDQAEGNQYDIKPRYFVFGGLVFTPLSRDYLRESARDATEGSGSELTYELFFRSREEPENVREEPVVLSSVLSDAVNANLKIRGRALVDSINGIRINQMADVVRAFETSTNAYDVIDFVRSHQFECLDHAAAVRANADILKTYGVPKDRNL